MIAGGARIMQDCPHYSLVVGAEVGKVVSTNGVGLRRSNFSLEDRKTIKKAFQTIFWRCRPLSTIKMRLREDSNQHVQKLADFIEASTRGICSGQKRKQIPGTPASRPVEQMQNNFTPL
jgi:acyl-[acyl carrier protein]--UDP-N-acetylglucosamine O-acyltransferase